MTAQLDALMAKLRSVEAEIEVDQRKPAATNRDREQNPSVKIVVANICQRLGSHPQNSLTPAQMQAQQAAQVQANDRARTRSRKPTDKNVPEGVEECVIGDGVQRYRDRRELERRLVPVLVLR